MLESKEQVFACVEDFLAGAEKPPVVVLLGPTASGKTALSLELAARFRGEIISADSRQVYRGIDVSAAKISHSEMRGVPHHLLDIRNPDETLTTQEWKMLAEEKIREIWGRGNLPIVCGGTMLYLSALMENYDFGNVGVQSELRAELEKLSTEELAYRLKTLDVGAAERINPKNKRHLLRAVEVAMSGAQKKTQESEFAFLRLGIWWEREALYARINARAEEQFTHGLVEETQAICAKYALDLPALSSFGYAEIVDYLAGKLTMAQALEQNRQRNRNYAKHQMTWWKRDGEIVWVDGAGL